MSENSADRGHNSKSDQVWQKGDPDMIEKGELPRPGIIPAHTDCMGYDVPPRSECCHAGVVYYNRRVDQFIEWDGEASAKVQCKSCNRVLGKNRITDRGE